MKYCFSPLWEVAPLAIQQVRHLVDRDEDLADVAGDEQGHDAKEHQRDAAVAAPAGGLLKRFFL